MTDSVAPETKKTTLDFDADVYRALKLHAVTTDQPIRELVNRYVRAGLAYDGAPTTVRRPDA